MTFQWWRRSGECALVGGLLFAPAATKERQMTKGWLPGSD